MHSIRFKITAITIVAILTTALCVLMASFFTIQAENDRKSAETMNLVAQDTRKSLEKYTEDIEQSVEIVAFIASDMLDGAELLKDGVGGGDLGQAERTPEQHARLDAYLADYTSRLQTAAATIASNTRGAITYYYCINPEVSTTQHGFFYSKVGKTGFYQREPLDARELDPDDMEHTTWYYTPIKRGRPSWVGPYTAHFLDEMRISSYLVPIYKSGALIGVLGMDISIETLVEQVSSIRVFDTGFACLLDEKGRILYHPDLPEGSELELLTGAEELELKESGDEPIRYTAANGETRQMSFTTLSNGMKLVITAPTSEVDASLIGLARGILPVTVLIIVVFTVIILLAMRVITEPLQRLTAASQRLAASDYDVELDYASRDEVGTLTSAFQHMRDQLKENIDDLNRKVLTDDLTGLPNQRHFFNLASEKHDRLLAEGKKPVMLYFNLQGMKDYNRQYGFDEGDRLICEIAEILARHFGEQETGRFGQDHFAAVSREENLDERLRDVLDECKAANGGNSLPVSVGIYQASMESVSASDACDRAKYACDQRRGSYVSGFCYFDRTMLKQIENSRYVISHIDQALAERWIEVHYQPIVRAATSEVCDEEALSRWNDPERGMLPPALFVPALEDAGLVYRLDLYVLDRVLEKMKLQKEAGLPMVPHSINLSRSDFDSCDIVEEIRDRVDASGIERRMITVELTESIIGSDFDFMKGQVRRFQELGFPVWMDDFGSGYSSLDVLQSIRFDLLKFDMSFTQKLDEGEDGKIILSELMHMATRLGIETVCEGVEIESQRDFLQSIGCSKLQGYYFCKPLSFEAILERYRTGSQRLGFEGWEGLS